ncbi:L-asparaginase [Citrobacter amalonaticus]|uniref:L-asparaginase n=1 Tax=Citrobacter amalonaticus TaxID=35703 RepID=A0A2S4S030_CITAM|nr:L-asparaginase [Citrobacter amalonaticus]POT76222.1 L-asparaginase [Citrobacter amalonaticus]POU66779.1 L-asparaginase [Citrobacter amalonaticus]POV05457.1 L-asparaginase [Citrobacter amalonaticus]
MFLDCIKSLVHQAILFAILVQGSAHHPHVLRVRSGCCALSASRLAATVYAW